MGGGHKLGGLDSQTHMTTYKNRKLTGTYCIDQETLLTWAGQESEKEGMDVRVSLICVAVHLKRTQRYKSIHSNNIF